MPELRLASDLSIPLEAVTQTFAILAKRGAGKTYTALVMVEEMLSCGLQVVVIDPVGVCWGLRTSADGKSAGLPIIVLGGEHGDLTIEATVGAAIADFVIQERQSVVIDLSDFSNNEMVRLVTDFAERLYQKNRTPLHLVLDEADSFAPQKPLPGDQRMLGAIDKIVRRGRAKGLGVSLVSQRPAVINKNVLTQIEVLIALRTVSPQDRRAIEDWIEVHGTQEQHDQLLNSLPSLPIGTAWVWSPGWLDIFQRVQVRQRKTFDSSATPKIGTTREMPRVMAKVNLPVLRQRFAEFTAQKQSQKQEGELERLRKLVVNLENQLARKVAAQPIFQDGEVERLEGAIHSLKEAGDQMVAIAQELSIALSKATTSATTPTARTNPIYMHEQSNSSETSLKPSKQPLALTASQQRILDTLAAFETLGLRDVSRSNVAVFANQSPKSSGFTNNLGSLRSQGLIDYPVGGRVRLTDCGREIARSTNSIHTLTQLHVAWYGKLPKPQAKILQALIERYPNAIDREALAKLVGQSPTSSGYTNNLGALRSLGVIDYPKPKYVVATELLFPLPKTAGEVGLLRAK
jgi:Mn-dependent DtxR family transcriptional regulator